MLPLRRGHPWRHSCNLAGSSRPGNNGPLIKCKLSQSIDRVVEPLVKALSSGIDSRFQAVLTDKEHIIAYALLPQFKLNFLPEDTRLSVKRQFFNYVQKVAFECPTETHLLTADVAQGDNDLFSFMNSAGKEAARTSAARQVEEFMESKSTSLLSLKDYPYVARAFVKANTVHCLAVQL